MSVVERRLKMLEDGLGLPRQLGDDVLDRLAQEAPEVQRFAYHPEQEIIQTLIGELRGQTSSSSIVSVERLYSVIGEEPPVFIRFLIELLRCRAQTI